MTEELKSYKDTTFDKIRKVDENGNEYWSARDLMVILDYADWRNFDNTISKAKIACQNSGSAVGSHFVDVTKMVESGVAALKINDYRLSRYACYLIVQNADSKKKMVALGQTYFAMQTRKQEITEEEYESLSEDEKRVYNRKIIKDKNKILYGVAKESGVKNFGKFTNFGYKGLYDGETAGDIKERKGLSKKDDILDYMGGEELGANIFRITQTEAKLKKDNVKNEDDANITHYNVGRSVRKAIEEIGGDMPESLPTPRKGIKQIEKEEKQRMKEIDSKKEEDQEHKEIVQD